MAQTILVRSGLTAEMVSAGRRLLRHLDAAGIVFEAALWLLDADIDEWHLVVGTDAVHSEGPKALYRAVNVAMSQVTPVGVLSIEMISIVDRAEPIVEALTDRLGTAESVDGARLDHATVAGVRLPGCVLYRLTAAQALAPEDPATFP
jgi:hypothetical protein